MQSSYASHVGLVFNRQGAFVVSDGNPANWRTLEPHVPTVLEIFTHHHSLADAHRVYEATRGMRAQFLMTVSHLLADMVSGQTAMLLMKQKVLVCAAKELAQAFMLLNDSHLWPQSGNTSGIRDLSMMSKNMPLIAAALEEKFQPDVGEYPALTLAEFQSLAERLTAERLLTVPIGGIDFGDFKRPEPFCPQYGNLRGTSVDRYYLNKFVAEIRNEVKGVTLEIGGSKWNRELYKFTNTTSYRTMDLEDADIVVGVGTGLERRENVKLARELAEVLGAAIGATRRVTDANWLPRQHQIGLTGKAVAPKLYFALGIRGVMNHTIGIQRAQTIVAVNKDPEAPIFQVANYGVVGDCLQLIPALTQALAEAKQRRQGP